MAEDGPSPSRVTRLLLDCTDGDERARDEVLPLVYDELRRLAACICSASGTITRFNPPRSSTRRTFG